MVKLLLEPVNVLILDEPTNHLDIKSKMYWKEVKNFDGTLILVSHDQPTKWLTRFLNSRNVRIEHFETIDAFPRAHKVETMRELAMK
jgi:ATP-binding cassette subfamily F protein 3